MSIATALIPMFAAGLLLAAPRPVAAEGDAVEHEHGPRHGGYFGDADDLYHYEVLLRSGNQLILYVNDEHNQPLDVRTLEGHWTLSPDSPEATTGTFTPLDDGTSFITNLPPLETETIHVKVAVQKGRTWAELEVMLPVPPSAAGSSSAQAASP